MYSDSFDNYIEYAQETYDDTPTQVNLDYLNAYLEYKSYLTVARNVHLGTAPPPAPPAPVRPTAMPDIVTIPPGFGGAPYKFTLEQMVHYKLGQP